MKYLFIVLISISLLAYSCKENKKHTGRANETSADSGQSTVQSQNTIIVAEVGSIKITEQTIINRLAVEAAYDNKGLNKVSGLIMTINDALEMEFANKINQQPTANEIIDFKDHADKTSKAPEILNKIKNIYAADIKSYDLWFISPKIVNTKIRTYFSGNKTYNQQTFARIEPSLKMLRSGKSMKQTASALKLNYAVDSISAKPVDMTPALENYPDARLPFENPMLKYLTGMKVGDICPNIIEENYSFMVIRLTSKAKDKYIIERISVQKPDFDSWFKKEAASIPIMINNTEIIRELKSNYGNLWWLKNIL